MRVGIVSDVHEDLRQALTPLDQKGCGETSGEPIANRQAVQWMLVDMEMSAYAVRHFYRDLRLTQIYQGVSEMLRLRVAREMAR